MFENEITSTVCCAGTWRGLPVAVKTVRFQSVKDRHSFESAVAEAAIANNLTHPNIVATYAHELKATPCPTSNGPEDLVSWKLYLVQVSVPIFINKKHFCWML